MTPTHDNAPRTREGRDGVESWFLRANHAEQPRALWLKLTTLTRAGEAGVAEAWCSLFDGPRTAAWRTSVPLPAASLGQTAPDEISLRAAGTRWTLTNAGGASFGQMDGPAGSVRWDIRFSRVDGAHADPWCLLPSRRLVDGPFPRSKLLTPFPLLRFAGTVAWGDEVWTVDRMIGMQGHNWGAAHSPEYVWGQCVFLDGDGEVVGVAEGATGRVEVGPWTTPRLSLLCVRHGGREYRFDKLVDLWRQQPRLEFPRWTLRISGDDGDATLTMEGDPQRMVCLGYDNPRAPRRYCLNSKTAAVSLRVNPVDGDAFDLSSAHGGALEFLLPAEHPDVQPVV